MLDKELYQRIASMSVKMSLELYKLRNSFKINDEDLLYTLLFVPDVQLELVRDYCNRMVEQIEHI